MVGSTTRPGRQPPRHYEIVQWWHGRPDLLPDLKSHYIGLREPFCFRCGWLTPPPEEDMPTPTLWQRAGRWLDRAHLIDRTADGLDGVQNTVLLCGPCHKYMPEFVPGDEDGVVAWVAEHPRRPYEWQVLTDMFEDDLPEAKRMPKMWLRFLENRCDWLVDDLAEARSSPRS